MSSVPSDFVKLLSNDNTRNIKYTMVFFLFFVGLSQNVFENLFGCKIKEILKSNILRHLICFTFLFFLYDYGATLSVEDGGTRPNPIKNLGVSAIIYSLVFLLFQTNIFYIYFMSIIVIIFIILDKIKAYYVHSVNDQEILQDNLGFLFKLNNVLVIIAILTIIIGTLTSSNLKNVLNTLITRKTC
jgi:energy-converting hydrogenase Eha subunit E